MDTVKGTPSTIEFILKMPKVHIPNIPCAIPRPRGAPRGRPAQPRVQPQPQVQLQTANRVNLEIAPAMTLKIGGNAEPGNVAKLIHEDVREAHVMINGRTLTGVNLKGLQTPPMNAEQPFEATFNANVNVAPPIPMAARISTSPMPVKLPSPTMPRINPANGITTIPTPAVTNVNTVNTIMTLPVLARSPANTSPILPTLATQTTTPTATNANTIMTLPMLTQRSPTNTSPVLPVLDTPTPANATKLPTLTNVVLPTLGELPITKNEATVLPVLKELHIARNEGVVLPVLEELRTMNATTPNVDTQANEPAAIHLAPINVPNFATANDEHSDFESDDEDDDDEDDEDEYSDEYSDDE